MMKIEQVIAEAKETNSTSIDLSDYQLKTLPVEVFQLKKLKKLYLTGDNLA